MHRGYWFSWCAWKWGLHFASNFEECVSVDQRCHDGEVVTDYSLFPLPLLISNSYCGDQQCFAAKQYDFRALQITINMTLFRFLQITLWYFNVKYCDGGRAREKWGGDYDWMTEQSKVVESVACPSWGGLPLGPVWLVWVVNHLSFWLCGWWCCWWVLESYESACGWIMSRFAYSGVGDISSFEQPNWEKPIFHRLINMMAVYEQLQGRPRYSFQNNEFAKPYHWNS